VPPPDELGEPAAARDLARAANDELAELVGRYPDRFAGFTAALPMSDPHAAAAELDRAIGQLGALGAQVHTGYFRRFYADTAMFGAGHAVRCAVEFFGAGHVLFGTDMPLGGPTVVADTIADISSLSLPTADEAAIFAGNSRRLLGIAA